MARHPRHTVVALGAGLAMALAGACGGAQSEPPSFSATTSATSGPPSRAYDSNGAMYLLFPGFGLTSQNTYAALDAVRDAGDTSMVPVLVETMRFQSSRQTREATARVLQDLTGQGFGADDWKRWMEWLGEHRDRYRPPESYAEWKRDIMSQIDARYSLLLRDAEETSRVDLTEVVWGGVPPDGIPDLRNPPTLPAGEAGYLGEDERVFGVEINGKSRAYPLRITNPHEMVNDVLGGEPISLAW